MPLMILSSDALIESFSVMLFNVEMKTIEETRLERLKILIEEVGGAQILADKLRVTYAQVSQWVNQSPDSKTGKPRTLNSSSARRMEEACGKPRGWFDQPVYTENENIINAIDALASLPPAEATKIADAIGILCKKEKVNEK
ncbi:MAG: hypothetical protein H0X02_04820 [Nitrosomonas sp.]|nr:hypothetical protein [Nitrosomonas sp.]